MAEILFLALTALLVYIFLGYPVLLFLLSAVLPRCHKLDDAHEPTVTLIISARNEARVIGAKLENSLDLDYPRDRLMILVVSDCSTDGTDEIVRSYGDRGVVLVRQDERLGKTAGLNVAMGRVNSDVVVFSDANAMYDQSAVRRLVRHFTDAKVGYVVGHARYETGARTAAGCSEGTYWDLEIMIKSWESACSSVVGGDGAIYAIRSELYEPLHETDINDFVNPLQIVAKGYRGIFDPQAWCLEKPAGLFHKEFARKVRIVNRSFNGVIRVPAAFNPIRVGLFAWQLVSHKLLRWCLPLILVAHFASALAVENGSLTEALGFVTITIYGALAVLALFGWWHDKRGKAKAVFYLPYYFTLINLASAIGVIMRLKGRVITTWETAREGATTGNNSADSLPFILFALSAISFAWIFHRIGLGNYLFDISIYILMIFLFHTYLGYPIILAVLATIRPGQIARGGNHLPECTLLIVAYNEEKDIEAKILNSLDLDYPRNLLRIVIASDGSTDKTCEIVKKYADHGIRLLDYSPNRGKIAALNDAMESIHSEIVVFSDANVTYERQAIRKLACNFADSRVGAVSGCVVMLNGSVSYGIPEKLYYCIEHFIQQKEGQMGMLIGADGAMYAIRRKLFRPPPADTILDDFVIAMTIACRGHLVVHEREAKGFEPNRQEVNGEFRRKVRIIAGGFQCLLRGDVVPSPSCLMLLFNFISHKVLRWFSGLLGVILLLLLLFVQVAAPETDPVFTFVLTGIISLIALAMLAHFIPALRRVGPISMTHYILMLSLASIVGLHRWLTGKQRVTWREGVS